MPENSNETPADLPPPSTGGANSALSAEKPKCACCSKLATALAILLILGGAAVRVRGYLGNRGLWRDEAALALNIVHRPFLGLIKPLDNDQGAPVGFLFIEKICVRFMGNNERALRLWPLSMSILALPLFYGLARRHLSPWASVLAIALLSLAYRQIHYASECKQYSTDVAVAVGMLLLASWTLGRGLTWLGTIFLAVAGAIVVWFSHPAVFVLAGVGAMFGINYWQQRTATASPMQPDLSSTTGRSRVLTGQSFLLAGLAVAGIWAVSFLCVWMIVLRHLSESPFMHWFWQLAGAFAPMPRHLRDLGPLTYWLKKKFFEVFEDPGSLAFPGLSAFAFILGLVATSRRNRPLLAALIVPILLAMIASMLHRYPFQSRLILFIGPALVFLIAAGIESLAKAFKSPCLIVATASTLLLISPVQSSMTEFRHPSKQHEMKDAIVHIAAHRTPGDIVYLYPFADYPFEYYNERYPLTQVTVMEGELKGAVKNGGDWITGWADCQKILNDLRDKAGPGGHVWFIWEDTASHEGVNEQVMTDKLLEPMAKRVDQYEPIGESVEEYQFN